MVVSELNISARIGDRTRMKYEYHGHESRRISYMYKRIYLRVTSYEIIWLRP